MKKNFKALKELIIEDLKNPSFIDICMTMQEDNNCNFSKKVILKVDPEDGFMTVFPSILQAAKSINENEDKYIEIKNNISKCINNKRDSAYGYMWFLIGEN